MSSASFLTSRLFIGNAVTFTGAVILVTMGLLKTKRSILLAQCAQCLLMGVGNLILGGVTGFVANMASILRNLVCLKTEFTVPLKLFFIVLHLALGLPFNNLGAIGLLPVIAACIMTWFLDTKSEITLKACLILIQVMWAVYDFTIRNFVGFTMDILTILSNAVGIRLLIRDHK